MRDYIKTLERLLSLSPLSKIKRGLETTLALSEALGRPSDSFPTIHIAGSNGKGSVATKIAKALECSGYRVGLYTSPHLFHFQERITVNGQPISEEEITSRLHAIFTKDDALQLNATFFEMTTLLAFTYFRAMNVDIAVIETGLGGRLDATNIIHPLLSVITSISCEHAQILGENIELIAAEKAGIIKNNVPVILGPKARCQSIYDRAKQTCSPVYASKKISYFYDEENTAIAELSLEHLASYFPGSGNTITAESIQEGLQVRPPCRFEKLNGALLDVAHNPDAIFSLLQALHTFFPNRKFRFLVGFSKDKEYDRCLALIADVATHIHLVQANLARAASIEELQSALSGEDPHLFSPHSSIEEGVHIAYTEALSQEEILVICGSFYIMADAKRVLMTQPCKNLWDVSEKILPSFAVSSSLS